MCIYIYILYMYIIILIYYQYFQTIYNHFVEVCRGDTRIQKMTASHILLGAPGWWTTRYACALRHVPSMGQRAAQYMDVPGVAYLGIHQYLR